MPSFTVATDWQTAGILPTKMKVGQTMALSVSYSLNIPTSWIVVTGLGCELSLDVWVKLFQMSLKRLYLKTQEICFVFL